MTLPQFEAVLLGLSLLASTAGLASGCTGGTHPLDGDGSVEIFTSADGPLFAKRSENYLVGRQTPYEMNVSLFMTRGGKPEHGAFVDVRVNPGPALSLHTTDGTCEPVEGAFRCTGNAEGYAHFLVRSDDSWTGTARLLVIWSNTSAGIDIHVKPPGLPEGSSDFELLAEGTDGTEAARVRPSYPFTNLCNLGGDEPTRWPAPNLPIRQAKLRVRALAPLDNPGVLANAPVLLASDSTEAEFSTVEACSNRLTRLVVQLNATGESPAVYVCFSNVGGTIKVTAKSGEITSGPSRSFVVDPEPRLLEIKPLVPSVTLGTQTDLWQVVAYGAAYLLPIALEVEYGRTGVPLIFRQTTAKLSVDSNAPTVISVTPLALGDAGVRVYPQFRSDKACLAPEIPVVPPDAGPDAVEEEGGEP